MPHLITHPRHQSFLQREFGLRGASVAPHLESTIQPVVLVAQPPLEDISASSDTRRCAVTSSGTSDASHSLFFVLAPAQNIVVVVRGITISAGSSAVTQPLTVATLTSVPGGAATTQRGTFTNRRLGDGSAAGESGASVLSTFQTAAAPSTVSNFITWDFQQLGLAENVLADLLPTTLVLSDREALFVGCTLGTTQTFRVTLLYDEVTGTGER